MRQLEAFGITQYFFVEGGLLILSLDIISWSPFVPDRPPPVSELLDEYGKFWFLGDDWS